MKISDFKKKALSLVSTTLVICLVTCRSLLAQEHHTTDHESSSAHKISLAIGHAHIHEGIEGGEKKWLIVGSWALNYDYLINQKWAVGLHNDIILEDFTVEDRSKEGEEHTILERERPIATKLVGSFKPGKHFNLILGAGEEIAKDKNFFLSTFGADYGWHLSGGWEVGLELSYDIKWKAYDTWILGAGISKLIPVRHKHKG